MPEPHLVATSPSRVGRPLSTDQIRGIQRAEGKSPVERLPTSLGGAMLQLVDRYGAENVREALDFVAPVPPESLEGSEVDTEPPAA